MRRKSMVQNIVLILCVIGIAACSPQHSSAGGEAISQGPNNQPLDSTGDAGSEKIANDASLPKFPLHLLKGDSPAQSIVIPKVGYYIWQPSRRKSLQVTATSLSSVTLKFHCADECALSSDEQIGVTYHLGPSGYLELPGYSRVKILRAAGNTITIDDVSRSTGETIYRSVWLF